MTDIPTRDSPISFRFGKTREDRFRAFQKARKLSQSDAIHHLLDLGLEAEGFPLKSIGSRVKVQQGPSPVAPGSRLKKDPAVKKRWQV